MINGEIGDAVFDEIVKWDSMVIFGHKNPDGDCVGSVMGLKKALQALFPTKKIYAVGSHPSYLPSFIEPSDDVSVETITNSLAIMVDLSDLPRVEDQRILLAPKIVCVDHHIESVKNDFLTYRVESAASASEVITACLLRKYGHIPSEAASYLYLGLVTDSGRFQFDAEPETFEIAAQLVKAGAKYKTIYRELYRQSSLDLKWRSFIYTHFEVDDLVTYCICHKEDYLSLGITQNDASGKVNLLSMLDGRPLWALFVEQDDGNIRVELRSDGTKDVQKVAIKFGGGGHLAASGCKVHDFAEIKEVLKALNETQDLSE
jgi:phosphoesterase RecJ-like protein